MPESIENAKSLGLEQVYQHDLHDPWPVSERSDAVILLDVLEHLRDPVLALRNAAKCLSDKGKIIFTVPAYPWLFSEWDERLGHFRRYTASMVRGQAEEAGLRLLELSHWNAFTFPVACILRWVRRIRPTSKGAEFPKVAPWMNQMLMGAATLERGIGQKVPIPFGLSLAGVFAK